MLHSIFVYTQCPVILDDFRGLLTVLKPIVGHVIFLRNRIRGLQYCVTDEIRLHTTSGHFRPVSEPRRQPQALRV